MNSVEERLGKLETRVARYRNFNILLCFLLLAMISVASTEGISPLRIGSFLAPIPKPKADFEIPNAPTEDTPATRHPAAQRSGKATAQTQGPIRTSGLQIVNSTGQAVVELWPSTVGGGLIFVNSPEGRQLVYIGSSASSGNGHVLINTTEENNLIALGSGVESGDGLIGIKNKNGVRLISLDADETPTIFIDNESENLAYLGASTLGTGLLSLSNASGKGLVSMYADETAGNVDLYNNNDQQIAYLGWTGEGRGVLRLKSETGTELITAGSNTNDNGLIRVSNRYGTLGAWIVGANENGYIGIQDNRERLLADMTATLDGNGIVRTLSPQGITTWSSNSAQSNAGSTTSLRGDLDNDGDVDGDDFLIFSENFGKGQ